MYQIKDKTSQADVRKAKRVFLVYQAGIANVFAVDSHNLSNFGRNAKRLMQADFQTCVVFCKGLAVRGSIVRTAACNMAGDIADQHWSEDLEGAPFSDSSYFADLTLN